MDIINIILAALTAVFGAFGFIAPRWTASVLDLEPIRTNMGLSEIRASTGGLFVALGLGAILIGTPMAYGMMGIAYVGAASGRVLSIFVDSPPRSKALLYFAIEAAFAAWLVGYNLIAA